MTFPAKLTELINASTNEDGSVHEIYRQCLKEYLINHAEAIRDLVVAAEKAAAMKIVEQWELQEAVEKLRSNHDH